MPKLPRDNSDSSLHEKYKESDTKRRKRMGRGGAGNDNDKKKNLIEYNYDESSESDESDDECMFTGPVTRNRAKGLTSNRSLPPKTKRPRMEMDDDEEEDEEEPTEEEAEDEEQEDEMEDDEDEEASGLPPGTSLQINIGSFQDKSAAMVPKRHDLKKEPEQVKRFVELVNKPIEEIGIDAQIDHFKSMDSVHQEQLLDALERRPTATDTGAQLMFRILTMKISPELQAMALAKYQALQNMDPSTSEYFKQRAWLDKLCSMPFGNYRDLPVQLTRDGPDQCATFIQNARACLDKSVFGQDEAKLQVLQWMANKIANPEANGKSLLLVGPAGCGKTSLIKNGIAQALGWPFQFISLGGDSDASTYTGHQLVYESSHPGKIVNSLIGAKSMSMILMFDEVDKISTTPKGEEVQNLLVHLTDPVQNSLFEDKYLAGVPIDLSKVMFIFSANNISKIDRILLDRMNVIQLKGYSAKEKLVIAENYLLPEALQEVALTERVSIPKDVLEHLINVYASDDTGVRELKRCIEAVVQKINMLRMYNSKELPFYIKDFCLPFIVKREHVELFLKKRKDRDDGIPFGMYI